MAHAAYADFTLAVSRTKDQTTFFPVRVFGKLAESCENVKKGLRSWLKEDWTSQSTRTREAKRE
jgi:single-stranded DNA-binding protein